MWLLKTATDRCPKRQIELPKYKVQLTEGPCAPGAQVATDKRYPGPIYAMPGIPLVAYFGTPALG